MTKFTTLDHDGTLRTYDTETDSMFWEVVFDVFDWFSVRKAKKELKKVHKLLTIETLWGNKYDLKNCTMEKGQRVMEVIDKYEIAHDGKKLDLRKIQW